MYVHAMNFPLLCFQLCHVYMYSFMLVIGIYKCMYEMNVLCTTYNKCLGYIHMFLTYVHAPNNRRGGCLCIVISLTVLSL